jgi:uncharacterized RDD family membrane protein YckC
LTRANLLPICIETNKFEGVIAMNSFSTSLGTVEVVVHEASRVVSISRLNAEGRPVASTMCDWDTTDLATAIAGVKVPLSEAREIAGEVKAAHRDLEHRPVLQQQTHYPLQASQPRRMLQTAGVGIRFVALLLDAIIVFVPLGFIYGFLTTATQPGVATNSSANSTFSGKETLLFAVIGFGYYIFAEAFYGQTVGKRIVGIRVVDEDGGQVGFGAAVVRNLLRLVDGLFFYLVGALFAFSSPRGQRLGDRAARTVVVRRA